MMENINPHPCPFNGAVVCVDRSKCDRCGWNPDIAAERLHRIREDLKEGRKPNEQKKEPV